MFNPTDIRETQASLRTDFSATQKLLFKQFRLAITAGVDSYALPAGIVNIVKITYKGEKLYGDSQTLAKYNYTVPRSGTPKIYKQSSGDINKIQLWPKPDANVAALTGNFDYANEVIISAFIQENSTDKIYLPLMDYYFRFSAIRRHLVREGSTKSFRLAAAIATISESMLAFYEAVKVKIHFARTTTMRDVF